MKITFLRAEYFACVMFGISASIQPSLVIICRVIAALFFFRETYGAPATVAWGTAGAPIATDKS